MQIPNFIAEISSNHNQSLKRTRDLIRSAKNSGFSAVKFQLFKIDQLFHNKILQKSIKHRSRKKWELPVSFIEPIFLECKKSKIKLGFTPFYIDAVSILKEYVDFFKISSYEILWEDLLKECAKTGKPVILSTGMANLNEVKNAIKILKRNNCQKITLLHCVSNYPANVEDCNLKSIKFLKKKFRVPVGWSDHTKDFLILSRVISQYDAKDIEMHIDLDGKGYEFKSGHCWLPGESKKLISFFNSIKKIDGKFMKKNSKSENDERKWRADNFDGLRPLLMTRKKF